MSLEKETTTELAHYRSIFELAMLGTAQLDLKETRITWANSAFAAILGYTASEIVGLTLTDLTHHEDLPQTRQRIEDIRAGSGTSGNVERRYRRKDGSYIWVSIAATIKRDDTGRPTHLIGIMQDISERKRNELELRESESRLRMVMELGKIGMWEVDFLTSEAYWSPALKELCGVPEDFPATTEGFWRLVHPDDVAEVVRGNAELMKGRTSFPPFRIIRPDGKIRWLQNIGRVKKEGDKLIGVLVDVTEAREAEQLIEAQKANIVAASKMSALGEMAAGLAHEINNPVAIIHGHATLLKHVALHGGEPEVIKKTAEVVAQTADRISKITRSLLAFARDAGHDPFELTSLKSVIDDTAEFCRQRFRKYGVELSIDPVSPDLRIECRPVQVSQVLLNLLNNAFDAVEKSPKQQIHIAVKDLENFVEVSVKDSGPGIPAGLRERIFQPFFTTKEVGRGTGLGLSVASGLIQAHGGRLTFESSGEGTRFVITLPKKQ